MIVFQIQKQLKTLRRQMRVQVKVQAKVHMKVQAKNSKLWQQRSMQNKQGRNQVNKITHLKMTTERMRKTRRMKKIYRTLTSMP